MSKRIRFGEPIEVEVPEEMLPSEKLIDRSTTPTDFIRQQRSEPFHVYILDTVFEKIWKQLVNSPNIETGGILVGHPFQTLGNEGKTFTVIVGAVQQDSDSRSVGHFTVTPREIATARTEMEEIYPGLVAVGWYHSHPGHGVFLSGQDMAIARSIYNAEWHVALVVDPTKKQRPVGFFRGPEGEKLKGWLELTQIPISINAIQKYNQAKEMLTQWRLKEAHQLLIELDRLSDTPEMARWRIQGGYRDVKVLLHQLDSDYPKSLPQPGESSSVVSIKPEDNQDYLKISERYAEAEKVFNEAMKNDDVDQLRRTLQIFNWIESKSPGYKDTKMRIRATESVLSHLETKRSPRRTGWKSHTNQKPLTGSNIDKEV